MEKRTARGIRAGLGSVSLVILSPFLLKIIPQVLFLIVFVLLSKLFIAERHEVKGKNVFSFHSVKYTQFTFTSRQSLPGTIVLGLLFDHPEGFLMFLPSFFSGTKKKKTSREEKDHVLVSRAKRIRSDPFGRKKEVFGCRLEFWTNLSILKSFPHTVPTSVTHLPRPVP